MHNIILGLWSTSSRGGVGASCPPLCAVVDPYCSIFGILCVTGCKPVVLCKPPVPARTVSTGMPKGLDTNRVHRHPGPPDAPVCGPHQIDVDPTRDVSARPRVWLPPLCGEATEYPFQGSRRLHTQNPVGVGNKGIEVSTLLGASLQAHLLLCLLRLI